MPEIDKLRVLCLHGCRQDAEIFNQKTGSLRKVLKTLAEFHYVSAPHPISSFDEGDSHVYRSWWYTDPQKSYNSNIPSETVEGFDESVDLVLKTIKENGPFDGILGFSQGASLLGLISLMVARKELEANFKFVVLISGFKSPCIPHQKNYSQKVNIPSLHVIGENDKIIPKERSEELLSFFETAEVIYHPGGHHVAAGKDEKEGYRNFFKAMLSLRGENAESSV